LDPPASLLLAVSGGADSVALLDALASGRGRRDLKCLRFVVGHFDHGLRSESPLDAQLVAALAQERGLAFVQRATRVNAPRGCSLEHAARDLRYEALTSMADEAGCSAVVTAHTATDQAETVLWRLVRGAGAKGLGAMRPKRPLGHLQLLRPLLAVSREETRAYCQRRNLKFHDDPSNEDERPRARLRGEVLPVLERLVPGAVFRLAETAERLREDDDYLDGAAKLTATEEIRADAAASLPKPLLRRVLARWVGQKLGTRQRVASAHIGALERLLTTGRGEVELPASVLTRRVAFLEGGVLVLGERPRTPEIKDAEQPGVNRSCRSDF
jgi:tRNA(Ile)-lysidine synthase